MHQPAAIHAIRRIIAQSGDVEAAVCLVALDSILAGGDPRDALGLITQPGQRSFAARERLFQRDEFLRQLAARHFRELCPAQQADAILLAWRAYGRRARDADAGRDDLPAGYSGRPLEFMFALSKLLGPMATLPKKRRLLDILGP